ncbi:MAG: hypothetical protein HOC71_08870 [Candidatus Latescibacteria bacterium]|nr:hypothetical protein [Candidatus Latescibacterota bacterium]
MFITDIEAAAISAFPGRIDSPPVSLMIQKSLSWRFCTNFYRPGSFINLSTSPDSDVCKKFAG